MSLQLGTIKTIVVSSPDMAREVLQKHELTFHSRFSPVGAQALDHHKYSMVWVPLGAQWRKLRKISKEQMFSIQRLDGSQSLREEKLRALCDYVKKCSESGQAVEIGRLAFTISLNLLSNTLFSMDFAAFDSDSSQEIKEIVWGVMESVGKTDVGDYFPLLGRLDIQGSRREVEFHFKKFLEIFDGIIRERLKSRGVSLSSSSTLVKKDLLEVLMDLNQSNESDFSWDDIKHLFLDIFVGGTDTTSSTVEWAMALLLQNPEKMSKAKTEMKNIIGSKTEHIIQESDIPKLPYLQAIVKETLRLHPPLPFILRQAPENNDTEIIGNFSVPKNAQLLVNLWAIGHDSSVWARPDSFEPERFLEDNPKDFKGRDFELLTFGTGRRICPGLPLAYRTVHMMLALLVHNFDWGLEKGMKPGEMDMTEKFGLSVQKAVHLMAVPIKSGL
ncbi:hypothetical protein DH2020_002252 [Rehmannia glutinosa]|uniref:Cytochrome P450 n=1 Tax=Rehmannia glutinosa TaxID=99300 RepID=A0ABR0XT58_REHGL